VWKSKWLTVNIGTVDESSSNSRVYGYSILIGIGAGMFIQAGFSVAQAKVSPSRASDASSFIALAQNLGIVLALAISGAVFQNKALDELQRILPDLSRDALRGAISGSNSLVFKQIPAETRAKVLHAVVDAMSRTYYLVVAAGALTIVGSLFMKASCSSSLSREIEGNGANLMVAREDLHAGCYCGMSDTW